MRQPASQHNRLELVLDHAAAGQGTNPQIKHLAGTRFDFFPPSKLLGYFSLSSAKGCPADMLAVLSPAREDLTGTRRKRN